MTLSLCLFLLYVTQLDAVLTGKKTDPEITLYKNYNQGYNVVVSKGNSAGGTIQYIDTFDTTAECQAACLVYNVRCWSFIHFPTNLLNESDDDWTGQCFAVVSPGFNPSYDPTTVSGVVSWPCRDDDDCSLNGECSSDGQCKCRPAWKGM